VSSPGDLLQLVPYLLGFRPEESVVLVVMRDREVVLAARVDLPPPSGRAALLERFTAIADQNEASSVAVFAFDADHQAACELLGDLIPGLTPFGLVDAIHADGHRWWSVMCRQGCYPPEGTPYDLDTGVMAAEAVYAGLVVHPTRADIARQVEGPPPDDVPELAEVSGRVAAGLRGRSRHHRQALVTDLVEDFVADPRGLADEECLRLAWLVTDLDVRDTAWTLMTRTAALDHVDLWRQVVARAVDPLGAAPVCLLGMAAWISGQGALMVCCIERVMTIDPGYTLGGLLDDINRRGLPPTAWELIADPLRMKMATRSAQM